MEYCLDQLVTNLPVALEVHVYMCSIIMYNLKCQYNCAHVSTFYLYFQILVWHTRTEKYKIKNEAKLKLRRGKGTNPNIEI